MMPMGVALSTAEFSAFILCNRLHEGHPDFCHAGPMKTVLVNRAPVSGTIRSSRHRCLFARKSSLSIWVRTYPNPAALSAMLEPMKKYRPTMFSSGDPTSTALFLHFNGKSTPAFCVKITRCPAQTLSCCRRVNKCPIQCIWCSRYTTRQEYPGKLSGMKRVLIGGKISGSHRNFAPTLSTIIAIMVAAISNCACAALCTWMNSLRLSVVESNHTRTLCFNMKPRMDCSRQKFSFDGQIMSVK